MSKKNPGKALVYLPANAKLNFKNDVMEPPIVKYEKRRAAFDKDSVKKIVKGLYGSEES
jgi:hypothetical protein